MAMIFEGTDAKLKASLSKIYAPAPLKTPQRDAVPSQETYGPLTMAIRAIQQSKQRAVEMVSEGGGAAAADGSVGNSLKRKADAV